MIITVGGMVGSGKSTLGKGIAERFGMDYVSAGGVMREMAQGRGMTLHEFSAYAEDHPEIDKKIDEIQVEGITENCVVDGRLAAYFATGPDLRICLISQLDVRARRVSAREGTPLKEARDGILERERSERKRYRGIYGIDLDDLAVYDLVINTGVFGIDATSAIVSEAIDSLKTQI